MNEQMNFTLQGALLGARRSLPLVLSDAAYGLVFGMLARQAGLHLPEAVLMSALVFAGSAQFVAVQMWLAPLPIVPIVLTTLVINLRHILMGASLRPWLARLSTLQTYGSAFFISDESWALTIREYDENRANGSFLLGCGLALFVGWVGATYVGYLASAVVQDPIRWGLDFAFVAAFVSLLVGMWKSKADALPWLVAAIVAVAASHWLPGKWYIVLGGLAGSLAGVIRDAK